MGTSVKLCERRRGGQSTTRVLDELDLGLTAEDPDFGHQYLSEETVGDLVQTIAAIYSNQYGTVAPSRR